VSENIIDFQAAGRSRKHRRRPYRSYSQRGSNMRTFLFRSSHLIVESDEADLVRDVGLALDRAQTKLGQIKRRLKGVQEQAAAQVKLLSTADAKLSAAIVIALLSTASDRNGEKGDSNNDQNNS
jgi:hypothetical protein